MQVDCKNVRPRLDAIEAAAAALEAESDKPTAATATTAAATTTADTTSTAAAVVQGMAKGEVDEAFQQVYITSQTIESALF
jgi:hypothetical protein